jgi:hypothetical protein
MIVVRNVFQLKFGRAKEALDLWKQGAAIIHRALPGRGMTRILTDLVGQSYTLVVENSFDSLADFEKSSQALMANPEWRDWYPKFLPVAESAHREIFTVVE